MTSLNVCNLKYDNTNLSVKQSIADTEHRLVFAKGMGAGGGMEWEVGVCRCKLLYMEWINKVPLYSTENYIQCPMMNHNGKEYNKKNAHLSVYD